ncbi:hypothetical protein [Polaromonas sp. CG9_12]|nr:hypothetical protein [Polaromonas sp. CG9_12]
MGGDLAVRGWWRRHRMGMRGGDWSVLLYKPRGRAGHRVVVGGIGMDFPWNPASVNPAAAICY